MSHNFAKIMDLKSHQLTDINKNKDLAAVGYLWILSVIILFAKRESAYVQFHARQGTFLFILSVIFWLVPYLFYLNILVLAAMVVGFITALNGEYYSMPLVNAVLEKILKRRELTADEQRIILTRDIETLKQTIQNDQQRLSALENELNNLK